jgi:ATP-binding cassette subfamily B protein
LTSDRRSFLSSWQERLSALRNVPPVLRIVWESGRGVVLFGIVARVVAALLPLALTYVAKLIFDLVATSIKTHEVPNRLWWLVLAEFSLAVISSILTRGIDYSDSLLANKYTLHVSIQVMKHASELDVTAYEDPVASRRPTVW